MPEKKQEMEREKLSKYEAEFNVLQDLMNHISTNDKFKNLETDAPTIHKMLQQCETDLKRRISHYKWVPDTEERL